MRLRRASWRARCEIESARPSRLTTLRPGWNVDSSGYSMSEGRQLFRRRRIYLLTIFVLVAVALTVLGFQSRHPTSRARRSIERSFSEAQRTPSLYELSRFGTQTCVNALTDLLAIRPSTGVDWYTKVYNKMPQ